MSKKAEDRLWVVMDGSIYVAEADDVKVAFSGKTMKVQQAIAFNVGEKLAEHIVRLHNQFQGLAHFAEFVKGNPERFKLHDFGPRGQTTDEPESWIGNNFLDPTK